MVEKQEQSELLGYIVCLGGILLLAYLCIFFVHLL